MKNTKKIVLELKKIGTADEWLLVVDLEDSQERGWLIGRKKEVEAIIEQLRRL